MVSLPGQIVQPGKEWDEQERRGRVSATSVVEELQPRRITEEVRGVSVSQPYQEEITTEMDQEWLRCRNYNSWPINRSIGSTASIIELIREIGALREMVQELCESNFALSEMVQELGESNSALQSKLFAIEEQLLKKAVLDNLWENSDRNVKALKEMSGLTQVQDRSIEQNPFDRLKGLLKEYSDDTADSAELVASVRGK